MSNVLRAERVEAAQRPIDAEVELLDSILVINASRVEQIVGLRSIRNTALAA